MTWLPWVIAGATGLLTTVLRRNGAHPGVVLAIALIGGGLAVAVLIGPHGSSTTSGEPQMSCADAWVAMADEWGTAIEIADEAGETELVTRIRGTLMGISVPEIRDQQDAAERAALIDISYEGPNRRLGDQVRVARFATHRVETNCVSR